jgi:transcriptional regulator with XRE-family HTH domain
MGRARNRPKRLAEKLLQIRKALGLSQREMAKRLGIEKSYNVVSKYERGKSLPTLGEIVAYSRAVNVHSEEIVDDDLDLNL